MEKYSREVFLGRMIEAIAACLIGFTIGWTTGVFHISPVEAKEHQSPRPVEINDPAVVVKLSGEKLEIKTIDLGTNEGLTEFSQWGSDYSLEYGKVEDVSLATFTRVIAGDPVYQSKARLFRRDGDKITYMDVPGWLEADATFKVNGQEYVFVGKHLFVGDGYTFFGRLVNLATGDISVDHFQFSVNVQLMVSPDKKLYWVSREHQTSYAMDFIGTVVHTVYNSDGRRLGDLAGPGEVSFLDKDTIGGVRVYTGYDRRACRYQVTLNLKTGEDDSRPLTCTPPGRGEEEVIPAGRPAVRTDYL